MKILVTGGTGFIGKKLVNELLSHGHQVTVITRNNNHDLPAGVKAVHCDLLTDICFPKGVISDTDIVYHCAGELNNESIMESLHVKGTSRLLNVVHEDAKKNKKLVHWVQLSSVGAYGPPHGSVSQERIVTENTPTKPSGVYETTKTISDELVMQTAKDNVISYTIVRPSIVIGQEMPNNSLRQLSEYIRKGIFFYIGRPGAIATYIHVDDVVRLLIICGFNSRAKNQIYNISNDCPLEYVVERMADATNTKRPRLRFPEFIIRGVVLFASKITNFPLTQERINALVTRTKYPYNKLKMNLGFKPEKYIPDMIGELLGQK